MKQLPEYWYVLYKDENEFDILKKWFNTNLYTFENRVNECGFCNLPNGLWFDSKHPPDINEAKEYNAIQFTFEEWEKYIVNKEPFTSPKFNLTKLLHILKFINNYGNITNKT